MWHLPLPDQELEAIREEYRCNGCRRVLPEACDSWYCSACWLEWKDKEPAAASPAAKVDADPKAAAAPAAKAASEPERPAAEGWRAPGCIRPTGLPLSRDCRCGCEVCVHAWNKYPKAPAAGAQSAAAADMAMAGDTADVESDFFDDPMEVDS